MGQDKLPLDLGGVPLISRVYQILEPLCDDMLVAGAGGQPVPARRVPDLRPGLLGPLAGIEAGLKVARHPLVFVAAGDMPFLSEGLVFRLLHLLAGRGVPAVVPFYGGRVHPLCAAYDRDRVLPAVSAALDRGVRAVHEMLDGLPGVLYVGDEELRTFGEPGRLLMNVNLPEDLARAWAMLGGP